MMKLTKAQIRALEILSDGEWHASSNRSSKRWVLCSNTVWRLHRKGLVNRYEPYREIQTKNPAYQYQINDAGREALEQEVSNADNNVRIV
jgi:hypothetical protein